MKKGLFAALLLAAAGVYLATKDNKSREEYIEEIKGVLTNGGDSLDSINKFELMTVEELKFSHELIVYGKKTSYTPAEIEIYNRIIGKYNIFG